ncbi:MAG TPA: hypothetical protein VHK89_02320 [Actinomycetota bacterium]|nr:hypothetical protein [Actinomycetota bacterium]
MNIDCSRCAMQHTHHCDDCVVSVLLHPPGAIELDDELDRSLQALAGAGLVPVLRFRPRDEDSSTPSGLGIEEAG